MVDRQEQRDSRLIPLRSCPNDGVHLTPAAPYARVPSDRQDVDLSVAAQLRALRDYARNDGYSVAREYVDEAESGRIADRSQFRQMIDEGGKATLPSRSSSHHDFM